MKVGVKYVIGEGLTPTTSVFGKGHLKGFKSKVLTKYKNGVQFLVKIFLKKRCRTAIQVRLFHFLRILCTFRLLLILFFPLMREFFKELFFDAQYCRINANLGVI